MVCIDTDKEKSQSVEIMEFGKFAESSGVPSAKVLVFFSYMVESKAMLTNRA